MPEPGSPSAIDLSGLDPADLAKAVGRMPDKHLRQVTASDLRASVLEEVFSRKANPTMSFLRGKLRVQGDPTFAAQPACTFTIPGAEE